MVTNTHTNRQARQQAGETTQRAEERNGRGLSVCACCVVLWRGVRFGNSECTLA